MGIDIKEICSKKTIDIKRHILIVDDDSIIVALLENLLKSEGFEITSASNGKEALERIAHSSLYKSGKPDLILLDIDMPVMDGYQTCKKVRGRKEYESIPIIMVTAESDKKVIKKLFSIGANDYILKPYESEELLARILAHIRVKELIEERDRLYSQAEIYFQSYKRSNDATMITDTEGYIVDINQAFVNFYGYSKEEVIGKKPNILRDPHSTNGIFENMWTDILNPEKGYWKGEIMNLTKDKREIPIILSITTIMREGNVIGYMGIALDITARKQLEDTLREYNRTLEQSVMERTKEIENTQNATIIGLAKLAEYRDPETGGHLERIRNYCFIVSQELGSREKYKEFIDKHFIDSIYKSSPLHDIGKVGIPDSILLKPGRLTLDEFEIMKTHTVIGGDAISTAEKKLEEQKSSFLSMGKEIAYYHHEKFNGAGYPYGFKEDKIPLSARIMALADVYDALRSKRVYKEAWSHESTKDTIIKETGKHFDPDVVDAFLKLEEEFIKIKDRYHSEE
jgi:PAS domain S-box-containing protein